MSTPDPAHVDAVAEAIRAACSGPAIYRNDVGIALLDSTDPAVHAAMLDALTRHGVLTRAWTVIGDEWIVDALWAERGEAEDWARVHGGHVVGRLHEADWHEVTP